MDLQEVKRVGVGREAGSCTSSSFTGTVSAADRFTCFQSYWTTQYGHMFTSVSPSTSRIFGDRFWVSDYRFVIQSIEITKFTSCWYTSFWFTSYKGFYLW